MADTQPGDIDLLQRAKEGEAEAFGLLYRRRQAGIYRFALRMTGSAGTAEDVTQETFMALIRRPDGFDPNRGPLSAYLYGIARKQVLRQLQRDRAIVSLDAAGGEARDSLPEALVHREGPHEELARAESAGSLRRALLELTPTHREVVVLCELEGFHYAEAARALGCPVGTVRSRLHRARAQLTRALRPPQTTTQPVRAAR